MRPSVLLTTAREDRPVPNLPILHIGRPLFRVESQLIHVEPGSCITANLLGLEKFRTMAFRDMPDSSYLRPEHPGHYSEIAFNGFKFPLFPWLCLLP